MHRLYFRSLLLFLIVGVSGAEALGQSFRINQGGRVDVCDARFFDSGGQGGNHAGPAAGGVPLEITICSNDAANTHIVIGFSRLNIEGTLRVFDGENPAAPLLDQFTDTENENFISRATLANTSGCLTVQFESTGTGGAGWQASVNCTTACQPIEAETVGTVPAAEPDLTGFVDICPGDEVTFTARGVYDQNGIGYPQSDATSRFTWTFQDGDAVSGVGLTTVSHTFNEPGGYTVNVTIEDERGCVNTNQISQRVRVSGPPAFASPLEQPDPVCPGQVIDLSLDGGNNAAEITFAPEPQTISFTTSQERAERIPLPDVQGVVYSSPITFSVFQPGQVITSPDDIVSVCATVEHSWLGDLNIFLVCPSGTDTVFFTRQGFNDNTAGHFLGEATRDGNQTSAPPDPPGTYCWTVDAPLSMDRFIQVNNVPNRTRMPDTTNGVFYGALDNFGFDNIVGCPLNGTWSLNYEDFETEDSGWSFSWEITFREDLFPPVRSFTVPISTTRFESNDYVTANGSNAQFNAQNPGNYNVRIIAEDGFGCSYDTSLNLSVLSPLDPSCITCGPLVDRSSADLTVCDGQDITPDVAVNTPNDTLIRYESYAQAAFGNATYPDDANAYENVITIADFRPATITDVRTIDQVCIDLSNDGNLGDVTLELVSPAGESITLLSNFGGNGDDLLQTCFGPEATTQINTGGPPPYTGLWQTAPGSWQRLVNGPANGNWTLRAFDADGNDVGEFIRWSISLNYDRGLTYQWSPTTGLSCTDCPNPTITAANPITYTLEVNSANGCSDQATVNVAINTLDLILADNVTPIACSGETNGSIDLTVMGNETFSFAWNDGVTTEDRANLPAGDYTVTISDTDGCSDAFDFTIIEPDPLTLTLDAVTNVRCFGDANGQVEVSTTGGTPPYTYRWDDVNQGDTEDLGALTQGVYSLTVEDANGCTDILSANVEQPEEIMLSFTFNNVSCNGGNDGAATVAATGGVGDYTYLWETGATTPDVADLASGTYSVTVTDALDCTATGRVAIQQPTTPLTLQLTQDERGCFDAAQSRAVATASGGTLPYQYTWSNGETTALAIMLPAGTNTVTVTDFNNCTTVNTIEILERDPIVVDVQFRLPTCNDRSDGRAAAQVVSGGDPNDTYTYEWSTGATTPAIFDVPGGVVYRVSVTDAFGCTGVGERLMPAPPPITFDLTMDPVVCNGESNGSLTVSNITGPNGGPYDLQWGPAAGNRTTSTVDNLAAGQYRLTILGPQSCEIDTLLTVTEPAPLGATVDVQGVSCFGENDAIVTVIGTGGNGDYRYAWSNGSTQQRLTGLGAGTLTLTVTDARDCVVDLPVTVTQPDPITIATEAEDVLCLGDATGQITVIPGGGRPPYLYGIGNEAPTRNPVFIGLRAGSYENFVRDSAGCSVSTFTTVADGPDFQVVLPEDTTIIFGDSLLIAPLLIGGIGDVRYQWRGSYAGTLNCDTCTAVLARPEFEIDYNLFLVDDTGCTAEDRFRVSVRKIREVAVPTGFTPNGDGSNDRLVVHGRPGTIIESYQVFDRWANLVYTAENFGVNDNAAGWDGTVNNQLANAGVYFYKLVIRYDDNSTETRSGESTLIR